MDERTADGGGTVGKALDVLDRVARAARPVRFSDLLAAGGYPKATLHRLLRTLTHQGMLTFDPERQTYGLGVRLVRLAHAAWAQSSLAPVARTVLDQLSAEIGETIHLAELHDGQVLYVDKRSAVRPVAMFSEAGKVGPAYCTGVGKAMLAHLDEPELEAALNRQSFHRFTSATLCDPAALRVELAAVRARGHALDREEHEAGIICIAVPILLRSGRMIGALSVTSTTARSALDRLERLAPDLRRAAAAVAGEAESWWFPQSARAAPASGG